MKGIKLIVCIGCALVAAAAAITAVIIFKDEIIEYCTELKDKIGGKFARHNGEFSDYADM